MWQEFLTMLVVVGEKIGDKALFKMLEDTKQRLEKKTVTSDTGKLDEKAPPQQRKTPLNLTIQSIHKTSSFCLCEYAI